MFFLKKVILCILFVILMYYGGAGTQSDSTSLQGMGFVSVVLGFIVLYILFKIMWTAMSFLMAFSIIGGVVLFILYCLGMIGTNNGLGGSLNNVSNLFDSAQENTINDQQEKVADASAELEPIGLSSDDNVNGDNVEKTKNTEGFFGKLSNLFTGDSGSKQIKNFDLLDYPVLRGKAHVVTGSVLKIKGVNVQLLGIDAPNPEQTCSNSRGLSYSCGKKSITWLQDWLHGQVVKCHILGNIEQHRATGVCFLGEYDIAAAVVSAGWAVAYDKNTDVYEPYEQQARENLKGMWKGRFYRPSDWRKLQKRTAEVKFESNDSDWFNFDGWF